MKNNKRNLPTALYSDPNSVVSKHSSDRSQAAPRLTADPGAAKSQVLPSEGCLAGNEHSPPLPSSFAEAVSLFYFILSS